MAENISTVRRPSKAIIVPCVGEKVWGRQQAPASVPAKDAYVEPRFVKWRRYAEDSGLPWFILSTKYGLMRPDDAVENYNRGISAALKDVALIRTLQQQGREMEMTRFSELELLDYEKFQPLLQAAAPGVTIRIKRLTTSGAAQW